jgi:hypothetical protein
MFVINIVNNYRWWHLLAMASKNDKEKVQRGASRGSLAFLLAQLGATAAMKFSERLSAIGFSPPDAGVLRLISVSGGISQKAIGEQLGMFPSRVVALIDELE